MAKKLVKSSSQSSSAPSSSNGNGKSTTFEYFAPEARKVIVAGSFNGWRTSEATLARDREGRWTISLELAPGRYEYRFVVDGNWTNDQRPADRVPNPFGSYNSVVVVK